MPSRRSRSRRRAAGRQPQPVSAAQAPTTAGAPADTTPSPATETDDQPRRKEADRPRRTPWLELPDHVFLAGSVATILVAAVFRLYELPLVPFHHDEGINGFFVTNLARMGTWSYDPANYHGPTLFYVALVSEIIFGLNDTAMRLVPATFGLATVALVLAMRPFIGSVAALAGAAMLAVSPAATYFSRYFIHETLLVFFTLALVVSLLWYLRDGRERFLLLAAASLALLLATKETAFPTMIVLVIALTVSIVYVHLRTRRGGSRAELREEIGAVFRRLFSPERVVTSALVGMVIYVAFYSSFLGNPEGVLDSFAALAVWTETGGETQFQPPAQYLNWMLRGDPLILIVGFVGGVVVAARGNDRLATFIALWALGITAAYSLISYKVPWIALSMLVPLAITGGIGLRELMRVVMTSRRLQAMGAVALAGGLAFTTYQSVDLNFVRYDDEFASPYVFVHTTREAVALVNETKRIATVAGTGDQTGIVFSSPEYWPLPWYYRDYPRAGFFGSVVETSEAMIVFNLNQEAELPATITDRYVRKGDYTLRPGVELVMYVRSDLAAL